MVALLMTGASGFLGSYLYQHLCSSEGQAALQSRLGTTSDTGVSIHGTYHRHGFSGDAHIHGVDLTDAMAVDLLWQQVQPQAVIHSAAVSNAHQCEQDPEGTRHVNVDAAVALARRVAGAGIPFIFLSTGLVFGGDCAPYAETAAPHPLSHYGQQKAEAEAAILELCPQATVCRLPLLYGAATATGQCFLQGFLTQLRQDNSISLFTDEFRTPVEAGDAARGIVQMLAQGVTGIIHLGGPERLSRYDFGRIMARQFHLSLAQMVPKHRAEVNLPAPRPGDTALDSRRAFALGYRPRSVETALAAIATLDRSNPFGATAPTTIA